jgi:putative phage-type endonuclease
MTIIDCIQGSDEWFEARLGFVTASNFGKVLNKKTGRGLYMRKLAAERLTGLREESYKNDIMEVGSETEAEARKYYEAMNDCEVEQVGFVMRDEWIGGSPDGFVGEDGLIEIKCPLSSTHIEHILSGKMPIFHIPQVQGLLWITDRKWCDFVSFDPRVTSQPMFCLRIERDKEYFKRLAGEVGVFVNELKVMINKIDDKSF